MNNGWQVELRQSPGRFGYDLYILRKDFDGKVYILRENGEEDFQFGTGYPKPTLFLEHEVMQDLVQELHALNIRPKEAGKTEGLLEAQTSHLKDLRTLLKLK